MVGLLKTSYIMISTEICWLLPVKKKAFVQPSDALIAIDSKREQVGSPFTGRILQYYDFILG